MPWGCVTKWLEDAQLPFKHFFATVAEDITFEQVYPHFFDYLFRVARNFVLVENMPDTFYKPFFMATLIVNGKICVFRRNNGDVIALNCAQANKPDLYYVPENVLVVNPQFRGESYNLTPGVDCEVIYCTSQDMYRYGVATGGLYSLIDLTARQLADNWLSITCAMRNTRLTTAFAADDLVTKASIETAVREMYRGKPFTVVQKTLVDDLAVLPLQPAGAQQDLLQLLETHKYILSEFYAAIGIDEPQQMKKERLVTAEVEQGAELPMFNVYDILESITEGVERANKMFDLNMTVRINPLLVQALEGAEETGSETEDAGAVPETEGLPIQPAEAAEDKPEQSETETGEEVPALPEVSEPETVTEAAAEIIEAAAQIIEMQEGGGDDADDTERDQSGAGEIPGDDKP